MFHFRVLPQQLVKHFHTKRLCINFHLIKLLNQTNERTNFGTNNRVTVNWMKKRKKGICA